MSNTIVIIYGPSGVGKTTIIDELCRLHHFKMLVSYTSRNIRPGEIHGREYIFITKEEFLQKIDDGFFFEYTEKLGNYYGTPNFNLSDKRLVLNMDFNGAQKIKNKYNKSILIFLAPKSLKDLELRLKQRSNECVKRTHSISQEIKHYKQADYLIINDIIEDTIKNFMSIVNLHENNLKNIKIFELLLN